MASKENQRALNNLVYFTDPFDQDEFNRVERWKKTLQKAIDELELYKKALDNTCDLLVGGNIKMKDGHYKFYEDIFEDIMNKDGVVCATLIKKYVLKESEKQDV